MSNQTIIPPPAPMPEISLPYSGVWRRFLAWCIDRTIIDFSLLILFVPLALMTSVGSFLVFPVLAVFGGFIGFGAMFFWIFVDWIYFASFESSVRGATPGKRFMGLRVTDMQGNRISFARATLRYAGKILSTLPMMLGFVLAFFTRKTQALHDLIAETVVIKTR